MRLSDHLRFTIAFLLSVSIFTSQGVYAQVNKYFDMADRLIITQQYQKAINQYFKGISTYSISVRDSGRQQMRVWDDIGYAYLQLGNYDKAIENLNNALSFHPANYDARFYLAVAHLMNGDYDHARMELATIKKNIYFDDKWIDSAGIFRKRNGRILDRDDVVMAKNEKGVFLERIDTGEVIIHLDAFDETNEGAFYYVRGLCFWEIGQLQKAEKEFIKAIESSYDEIDVRLRLAELYIESARFEEAELQLDIVKGFDEDSKGAAELVKFVRTRSPFKSKISSNHKIKLNHRLKDHENSLLPEWHYKFFEVLREGRIKEAISLLEAALRIDERSFVINHNLALTCYDVAKIEDPHTEYLPKAEYYCARAIWLNDFAYVSKEYEAGTYDLMGNIYFYQSRYIDAKKEFLESLEIDPNNPSVLCNLGMAYYNLNDWVRAAEEWQKAIRSEKKYIKPKKKGEEGSDDELQYVVTVLRKPVSPRAHLYLGMLYRKQNLIEKSLTHFESAAALEPKNPAPYLDLGKIHQERGDEDKALECYEKYLYLGGREVEEAQKLIDSLKKK